jgi:hypothetical protein
MIKMLSAQKRKKVMAPGIVSPKSVNAAAEPVPEGRPQRLEEGLHGLAADEGLDAEPAAGDDRPQHRRDVGARPCRRRARRSTGNGMPYLVPGWALSRMGPSTMMLPRPMVSSACHQFMPTAMSPPASMYVGMQWAIEIHSAAKL